MRLPSSLPLCTVRILTVSAYATDDPHGSVVETVTTALAAGPTGHVVTQIDVLGENFGPHMSSAERVAYDTTEPLIADETRRSAELVLDAQALVFVYPTVMAGPPPVLKGWLDRVMVPGVAFTFSERNKVRRNLHQIRRIGLVSTVNPPERVSNRRDDLGYRILGRTLRLNCSLLCRTSRVAGPPGAEFDSRVLAAFGAW